MINEHEYPCIAKKVWPSDMNYKQTFQEFSKRVPGNLLTEPMKPSYLSSAKGGEEQQKSSSEAPIARLESLEEAGMEAASRDTKAPSIHKQRSSDV